MNLSALQYYKQQQGLSYAQISELSGVPLGTVQKIFSGETKSPRASTLKALQTVLFPQGKKTSTLPAEYNTQSPSVTSSMVCEPPAAYGTSPSAEPPHTQGSYTLDDYYALPDDCRAELIDGFLYVMEAPTTYHQLIAGELFFQLKSQVRANHGNCLTFAAPVDVQLDCDDKTMVEPDVLLLCATQKMIRRCIYGAPEFVVEVLSPSTRKKDLYLKLQKYANAGVQEYWIVDPDKKKVIIYILTGENYIPRITGFDCTVTLSVCEGKISIDLRELAALPEGTDDNPAVETSPQPEADSYNKNMP